MHLCPGRSAVAVLIALVGNLSALHAQLDYRNLDEGRPGRVEDAYSLERYAFELVVPYGLDWHKAGGTTHYAELELAYGLVPNGHLGVTAPFVVLSETGIDDVGLAGLGVFALYNFNTESRGLPAVALRADVHVPVGSFAAADARVALTGLVTRTWGRNRLHLNGGYGFGPSTAPAAVESPPRWWAGAALDRTLLRTSLLLIADVSLERMENTVPVEVNAGVGIRLQWSPSTVLDLGIGRGLRNGLGPELAVSVGLSHAFAFAGLMPRGR